MGEPVDLVTMPLLNDHVLDGVELAGRFVLEVYQVKQVVPFVVLHVDVLIKGLSGLLAGFDLVPTPTADKALLRIFSHFAITAAILVNLLSHDQPG